MLNIFQNLTASKLLSTSTSTIQITCQKYFDKPTSHAVKRNLQLVIKTAHSKIKKTTCVWHSRKVARIECPAHRHDTGKKRNRVQAKIFDRTAHTGTQSASACIHASTEIALKQHYFCAVKIALHRNFLRITFNFASQNFDFASQTAMRYRINSSLYTIII